MSPRPPATARAKSWSVYLIRTARGALYVGIATDVDRRLLKHAAARGAKFLRGRGPLAVVYRRKIGSRSLASQVEYAVKQLTKKKKEALVESAPSRRSLLADLEIDGHAVQSLENGLPPRKTIGGVFNR